MPNKVTRNQRELLFELVGAGYTTKEIRELTGISRQTQWRIRTKPDWRITERSYRGIQTVDITQSMGISVDRPTKAEFRDLVKKKTGSRFFSKYAGPVVRETAFGRKYREITMSPREFKTMSLDKLKSIVGDNPFYISYVGEHVKDRGADHVPYVYSSGAERRPDKKTLNRLKKELNNYLKRTAGGYTKNRLTGVIISQIINFGVK